MSCKNEGRRGLDDVEVEVADVLREAVGLEESHSRSEEGYREREVQSENESSRLPMPNDVENDCCVGCNTCKELIKKMRQAVSMASSDVILNNEAARSGKARLTSRDDLTCLTGWTPPPQP